MAAQEPTPDGSKLTAFGHLKVEQARRIKARQADRPLSTLDLSISDGSHIPIEQRTPTEVTHIGNTRIVPEGVSVFNPAFDVTPNELVNAIVTEVGVARAPYIETLAKLARSGQKA